MDAGACRYSCDSAENTMEWMAAIADFLRPLAPILDAHVVNFFKCRLWEALDEQWVECLRRAPTEDLIGIPCGLVREHWPTSLKQFVRTLRSLVLPREQKLSHEIFGKLQVAELGTVLSQGMNQKKKHEVEILSSVVVTISNAVASDTIIDVGAGQGYLAQVLCFKHQLSVIALDASSHHTTVTSVRAERIKKHFSAKLRKSSSGNINIHVPRTLTCKVLSSNNLAAVIQNNVEPSACGSQSSGSSLVLAGLHACGNLSVNMLRSFIECEQVKALVCVGCCYNLLSVEKHLGSLNASFPLSDGAKVLNLVFGRNACDLGCQSEERWKSLTEDSILQNFDVHAFRAALQLILDKYFPAEVAAVPSIGRQGKALRRRKLRREAAKWQISKGVNNSEFNRKDLPDGEANLLILESESSKVEMTNMHHKNMSRASLSEDLCSGKDQDGTRGRPDKFTLFEEFCRNGLNHLGLKNFEDIDFLGTWREAQPFIDLVGPYWSLRAALGPLVETYILLDRLLFLQEQDSEMEVELLPIFDPSLSPRNMAIIARKRC